MSRFLAPGATLGVMGGGQLARMFVHAAQRMGYATAVLEPDRASPAGQVAHHHVVADYEDPRGWAELAAISDAITTEFENVPAQALAALAERRPVAPGAGAVAVCQDRAAEKRHFQRCGVACAPHALVGASTVPQAIDPALFPGILKTVRHGYDGKGQVTVADPGALERAWTELGRVDCILELKLPLAHEISVIVARSATGDVVHLPVQQNLHRAGVLALTQVPAPDVGTALQNLAVASARQVAISLDYVGVLCVEFFVLRDGTLVANEMAPRPHNSGHYSLDACDVSQFEWQVRALVDAPLCAPRMHSASAMLNLMGDLWGRPGVAAATPDWAPVLALPGVHLHLYGKAQPRPGRKMGHLTVTAAEAGRCDEVARRAAQLLGIASW